MNAAFSTSALVVAHMGSAHFGAALIDALHTVLPFDGAMIVAFNEEDCQPICLAARLPRGEMRKAGSLFLNDYFGVFKNFGRSQLPALPGATITRYAKAQIDHPDFRRDLYDKPGISHDLELLDRIDRTSFYLGLYRCNPGAGFSGRDAMLVRDFWPLALACIVKHARITRTLQPWSSEHSQIRASTGSFLDHGLAQREAEVCSHIVSGYSAVAISMLLKISLNTVSTLRQRAYKKLNISCYNELYSLYLQHTRQCLHDLRVSPDMFAQCSW